MTASETPHITGTACFMAAFIAILLDRFVQALLPFIPWISAHCDDTWFVFANLGIAGLLALLITIFTRSAIRRQRTTA